MDSLNICDFLLSDPRYHILQNEFQTQSLVFNEPNIKEKVVDWLKKHKPEPLDKSNGQSEHFREKGNRLFRANKKKFAIEASRCYTNAIIAAPDGSRELALAHANRSASISELGYYKEAYEDCVCAIANGYPTDNLEKIIVRQAFYANKLEEYDKLSDCVEKLRTMTLSKPFAKQKDTFEEDLIKLSKDQKSEAETLSKDNYITQQILYHPEKGRYLTTKEDIGKGEVVLTEKAFALVPVDELKICANCAAQQIIPFPCNVCSKIFYCSLKCKKAQEMVHQFECYAYKCEIISTIGILHLTMNTLLNGFPSIIERIKHCKSGEEIWETIEEISQSGEKGYAEVLSLATHFKSTQTLHPNVFHVHCKGIALITFYLMEFTSFFDLFKGTNCTEHQWAVIISSLLLRHSLQMMYNASTSLNVFPMEDTDEFRPLSDKWEKPFHLKKGQLHMFARVRQTYAGIFPHLSVCNHSCEPSFRMKFDGNCVAAYARHRLKQGAEIHNAYVPDFKNNPKAMRKGDLKKIYHFDCKCKYCSDDDCDAAYFQFYRYRCHNARCKAIFVPQIENQEWWLEENKTPFLTCPNCQVKLKLDWYWVFFDLTLYPNAISKIIEILKISEKFVEGYSELRRHMYELTAQMIFTSANQGSHVSNMEFVALGEAVKYCLDVIEQKNDVKSVMYSAKVTYALDIMAHGKYLDFDCKKIRISLDMLSTEMRSIFNNYINDYIGEKFYAND